MKDFTARIEALPNNRRAETVLVLRELIKDMWDAGLPAIAIGRMLDKDHTTILHHLWYMGIKPMERQVETMTKQKAITNTFKAKEVKIKADARLKRKKEMDAITPKAVALWKKGYTYPEIAEMVGVSRANIQNYLHNSDEYHSLKQKRGKRPVYQLTLQGKKIRKFDSLREAGQDAQVSLAGIIHVCQGRQYTSGGYKWQYAD